MAEANPQSDEWGHLESKTFADGAVAGVMVGPNGVGRLNYARNGDPSKGYDRIWWYETPEDAIAFMRRWDGTISPDGFIRDLQVNPIDWREETR